MKNKFLSKLSPKLSLILSLIMITVLLSTFTFTSFAELIDNPFNDVNQDDWFYNDVVYAYNNGLMKGVAIDIFDPNAPLSRSMIVTLLYRIAGEPDVRGFTNPFSDVSEDKWYTDAVKWADVNRIVYGHENGIFDPEGDISRNDLATIFFRYVNFASLKLPKHRDYLGFNDDSQMSNYAKSAVKLLYQADIINGKPEKLFDPSGNATRAEAAALLHRFIINAEAQPNELLEKYSLEIRVSAGLDHMPILIDHMPIDDPGPKPSFHVMFTSFTNVDVPDISVSANITSTRNAIDVLLNTDDYVYPYYFKTFRVAEEDARQLKMTDGEYLTAVITFTIGNETNMLTFYPVVSSVW